MRSQCIPMSRAEFFLLPRQFGWRYEYNGTCAEIRPLHLAANLRLSLTPRPIPDTNCCLLDVKKEDEQRLVPAFADGFQDTVEYCDYTAKQVSHAGEEAIRTFFAGVRGQPHPLSCLAVPADQPSVVAAAALVVQRPDGPFLDMLFVRRQWHRQGLASALVGTVVNRLYASGEPFLGSAYNVANSESVAWHTKFGFVEQPDLILARLRAQHLHYELQRRLAIGDLSDAERLMLEADVTHWDRLASSLAAKAFAPGSAATGLGAESAA